VVVLVTAGVAAWSLRGGDGAERNGRGDIVTGGEMSAFSLREGDCWNDPPLDDVTATVAAVPCTRPHDAEVYAVYDVDLDEYPGDDQMAAAVELGCIDRFADFAGIDYATSALRVVDVSPTEASWNTRDDRSAVCSITDPAAPTTGSLQGAAR
jgi:hypothetical protein